jgi:ribosome recycling factor
MAVSFMAGNSGAQRTLGDLKRRMDQAVATFQANLASTRTGRASVHMLDQVKVDYYGTHTPINQLAQVSTPEAQLILIAPWDPTLSRRLRRPCAAPIWASIPVRRQGDPRARTAHDRGAAARRGAST